MSKDEVVRLIMHFPVGLFAAWLTIIMPVPGVLFTLGFYVYEVMNDWRKVDWSYKDVIGFVAGYGTLLAIWYVLTHYNLI